jgi:hypothetical protein
MLIWLRLIAKDREKFITYFIALQFSENIQHLKSTIKQSQAELDVYRPIVARQGKEILKLREKTRRNISRVLAKYSDIELSTSFLSYERTVRKKGFRPVVEALERRLDEHETAIIKLEQACEKAKQARGIWLREKWNWGKRAEEADLKIEYDFVYGYVSRLVHCKPASFHTDQKNLEYDEMILFHSFIIFIVGDILKIVQTKSI